VFAPEPHLYLSMELVIGSNHSHSTVGKQKCHLFVNNDFMRLGEGALGESSILWSTAIHHPKIQGFKEMVYSSALASSLFYIPCLIITNMVSKLTKLTHERKADQKKQNLNYLLAEAATSNHLSNHLSACSSVFLPSRPLRHPPHQP
jgi:hypothetical protein